MLLDKSIWKIILTCVVVLFVGIVYGKCSTSNEDWQKTYTDYRAQSQKIVASLQAKAKKTSDSINVEVRKKNDSLQKLAVKDASLTKQNATLTTQVTSLSTELGTLKPIFDSLNATLPAPVQVYVKDLEKKDSTLTVQNSVLTQQVAIKEAETQQVQGKLDLKTLDYISEHVRADSLQKVVINFPKPEAPSRLFGIFSVSPTTAFVVGSGTTLAVIAALVLRGK